MSDPIYLDHNATTPVLPEAVDAMIPYLREHFGNPSSAHIYGRRAKAAVERARAQVAALLGCDPEEIVFTSGGTEANNLALRGVTVAGAERDLVLSTNVEHPATAAVLRWLATQGSRVELVAVGRDGTTELSQWERSLTARTALVTVMHANNETGVLQPAAGIAALARQSGALVHLDAAQSVGKLEVNVRALGVDLLSLAGHKLYAPKGVGALYVRRGVALRPFALGAGHEGGARPGTENVASLVGLGVACEVAARTLQETATHAKAMRDRLWHLLSEGVAGLALNGHPSERLPNTLSVRFPGVSGTALLAACETVAASTGSACHAGGESASAVILAMGVRPEEAIGTVRLSTGRLSTSAQMDAAAEALIVAWRALIGR